MSQAYPFDSGDCHAISCDSPNTPSGWMRTAIAGSARCVVDANQLTSLCAMIAYMAIRSGQSEFRIERRLADHFDIPNAKLLPADQFEAAIRYLADTE